MTDHRFGPAEGEEPVDWALGYRLYLETEGFTRQKAKAAEESMFAWAAGIDPDGAKQAYLDLAAYLAIYHRI